VLATPLSASASGVASGVESEQTLSFFNEA
jgi:hypothetical protein